MRIYFFGMPENFGKGLVTIDFKEFSQRISENRFNTPVMEQVLFCGKYLVSFIKMNVKSQLLHNSLFLQLIKLVGRFFHFSDQRRIAIAKADHAGIVKGSFGRKEKLLFNFWFGKMTAYIPQ